MDLLILSLAPVFIIAVYIYFRDKYEKEPYRLLAMSLAAGAFTVIPILFVESFLDSFTPLFYGLMAEAWKAFAVAAFTEESFKFLALYLLIWRSPQFNDKFDGIVYAVFISLGFAAVENVMYVMGNGPFTGIVRAVTAVPAHAIFGITMGFYFGMAKFYPKKQAQLKQKALVAPVILHGMYNFILLTGIDWLSLIFIVFLGYLYYSGWKRIKELRKQSIYNNDWDLMNKTFNKP
jgi:RsiW-degrading membrane proteinase PrsW (M82 family)